jgi:myo-inositol-1(or 4)-monophosphatase
MLIDTGENRRERRLELDWQEHVEVAERAARYAGEILIEMAGNVSVREKGPGDLVTSADLASQEAIRQTIFDRFPTHAFVGEESAIESASDAELVWIVDPLDGTSNYVLGLEFFAVSIGLVRHGTPVVGVIYDPTQRRCFRATDQGGAYLDGQPIHVSQVSTLRNALLVTGFPPGMRGRDDLLRLFEEYCAESHSVRRLGSAALDLAYVACGKFDGFYAPNLRPWDAAAGVLLVQEAGGTITNLDGSPYNLYTPDILATNARIHDAMVNIANSMR